MSLLFVYIVSVAIGQVLSVTTGLIVERTYSSYAGLMVFIPMYFAMFWFAWMFAVRITAPRS